MRFQNRTTIARANGSDVLRVVWTESEKTFVISLDSKSKAWPYPLSGEELANYEEIPQTPLPSLSVAAFQYAQSTFARFSIVLGNVQPLLTPHGRMAAFKTLLAAEAMGPIVDGQPKEKLSSATFYKVILRWLRGGCTVGALSPEWHGSRESVDLRNIDDVGYAESVRICRAQAERLMQLPHEGLNESDHTRKGMPRKRHAVKEPTKYRVDRATVRVFRTFFRRKLAKPGMILPTAHKELLEEVFNVSAPTGKSEARATWTTPSFRQFEDWFFRTTSNRERRTALRGGHHFELNERALLTQGVTRAYTAGAEAQLDATVWNVPLVSELAGAAVIGPAIVFRIRCTDSGMLLGLCVSLESASWSGAASAIANCLEDKVEFCKRHGIDIGPDEWRVRGLPAKLSADCGETYNHKPDRFILSTNTNVQNLQVARGDLKPGVESDWNTLQVALNGFTPAAIIKAYEEKTLKQWRMAAAMTLKLFTKILILEELKRMRNPRLSLQLPHEMIAGGADSSPRSMWSWCAQNMPTALRTFDEQEVRLSLLDTHNGSITEFGVIFKGIAYVAQTLVENGAFEIARRRGRVSVTIGYDRRLVDTVFILEGNPENPSKYVRCDLNTQRQDQQDFSGKTFREVEQTMRLGNRQNHAAAAAASPVLADYTQQQKKTVAEAKARVANARREHPTTAHAQVKGMAAARELEKNLTSPEQALVAQSKAPVDQPETVVTKPASPKVAQNVLPISSARKARADRFVTRAGALKTKFVPSSNTLKERA